jgi:transposase
VKALSHDDLERKAREREQNLRRHFEALAKAGRTDDLMNMALSMLDKAMRQVDQLTLEKAAQRMPHKSEKIDPAQLALLLEALRPDELDDGDESAVEAPDAIVDEVNEVPPKPPRKRVGRNPLPADLPREVVRAVVPDDERVCDVCGQEKTCIGHDTSEQLELVPAHFKVIVHEREKLACSTCKDGVDTAPAAPKVIERGLPGPGLLAHIVVSKYADHLPIYRLARFYSRLGVTIARSTLASWSGRVAVEMKPVVAAMWKDLMAAPLLHTDGTGMPVLDHDHEDGIRVGTMWAYVGRDTEHDVVVFEYATDGTGANGPWKFLAGRVGYLQADGSNAFDRCFNGRVASAVEVGCWAHARRKFFDLLDTDPRAAVPMKLIAELYQLEKGFMARGLDLEAHQRERASKSARVLGRLKAWLDKTQGVSPPASNMAKAIGYILNQWDALNVFLRDARLPLDNTFCEQQIRGIAVGRRNYLFVGSDDGGTNAAVHYSIMRTCALNEVDPVDYLEDVLAKLADGWPQARIGELTPYGWLKAKKAAQQPQPNA